MAVTGAAGAVKGTRASGCLPERAAFTRRGLARLRLGATRAAAIRALGKPSRTRGRTATWCVHGNSRGKIGAVFERGRVIAVASTAPGHSWHGVGPGSSAKRAQGKRIAKGTFIRGTIVFRTHGKRVRLVALASRSLVRHPARLRRYLRAVVAAAR